MTSAAVQFANTDLDVLIRTPILSGLGREACQSLMAAGRICHFDQNEVIFEDNSIGQDLYIVLQGEVNVMLDPAKLGTIEPASIDLHAIRRIGPAQSFGELAVITGGPRTAGCVAALPNTRLFALSADTLTRLPASNVVLANIARDTANQVRTSNERVISMIVSGYFLTALVEELATGIHECSPVVPLQKLVVIRHPESFILTGPSRLLAESPDKEAIEFAFFADPLTLRSVAGPGSPSGNVIFKALWAVLQTGALSERIAGIVSPCRFESSSDRRTGSFVIEKQIENKRRVFHFEWQIKGARYDPATRTAQAGLFLGIYENEDFSTAGQARQMLAGIDMPVQKQILRKLSSSHPDFSKIRIVLIHHRSHEVAHTLDSLQQLGFQIDSFIGIPYGDVNWEYITMLDYVSGHHYLSLKLVLDPIEPPRYDFDFRQSSLLDLETERAIRSLFENPALAHNYIGAMQALGENRLVHALNLCRQRNERLLVYEDGGYIAARIYDLYRNPAHPLHATIKSAVDAGTIVGVVEVTVAGERKNLQAIEQNNGKALLAVLSNARSEIKSICEAMGVGEAVLNASATSFGRLGLSTFQARRIACIGGNGAIGTRLVEQFASLHNSTANVFVVDPSRSPFQRKLDAAVLPHAATRFEHRTLPRYFVSADCLPVSMAAYPDYASVANAVRNFLKQDTPYTELALANGALSSDAVTELWSDVAATTEFRVTQSEPLPGGAGFSYQLQRGDKSKRVSLLCRSAVFSFDSPFRLLRSGIDTIVGSTGFNIFGPRHLDAFFTRSNPSARADELVLISASSKDNEFRSAVAFLNDLVKLLSGTAAPSAADQLRWFAGLYQEEMSFLVDSDFPALRRLFANRVTLKSLRTFAADHRDIADRAGFLPSEPENDSEQLRIFLETKIRRALSIRKEIRPDIGSIYHLTVNGKSKRIVLLADGFVVNFFARHEKGVKTEYIDPVVTMQLLGAVLLSTTPVEPGVHKIDSYLRPEDIALLWSAINENCRPLTISEA
ncbi:MAG: cyclic nucleotide-binding domain-containing protein [Bryobacteraceae bacterium]